MNLQTQRLIDRWMGQALCALVSVWAQLTRRQQAVSAPKAANQAASTLASISASTSASTSAPRQAPAQVRHILVIMLSEMGSMVLAGPMLAHLRSRYPNATLHLLQLKKNQQVSTLLGITDPANMHALDDSSLSALVTSLWAVTRRLRALPVDAVIDCELFSRISALMAFASGAPRSAGFTRHTQEGLYRGDFLTCPVPYNPYRHISQQFVALVDALEPPASLPRSKWSLLHTLPRECGMAVDLTPAELSAFNARLLGDFPAIQPDGRKLVLLYASGGILPERAWPADHYVALGRGLAAAGHAVALIGLPEDKPLARQIQAGIGAGACFDLTGYTRSIRELLMLFHGADLLVTNDGGPGHFASLTSIRTFMFFGPETSRLYGPLSPRATVFDLHIACSPCLSAYNHRQTFCDGDNQCLKQIAPGPVLALALRELGAASDTVAPEAVERNAVDAEAVAG